MWVSKSLTVIAKNLSNATMFSANRRGIGHSQKLLGHPPRDLRLASSAHDAAAIRQSGNCAVLVALVQDRDPP